MNATQQQIENSYKHAIRLTRQARSQFFLSFLVLPKQQFRDISVLYAFLRLTDDLADQPTENPIAYIQIWRDQLEQALNGNTVAHPIFPSLMQVIDRYRIEPDWLFDVIAGVESDIHGPQLMTSEELERYCYQVAGTVGLCCMKIWGCHDHQEYQQQAITCGFAFQMTNILRDITEDVERGRCYLPDEELIQFGYSREHWDHYVNNDSYLQLMEFQLKRIEDAYRAASSLEQRLKGSSRKMFRLMYQTYYQLFQKVSQRRLQFNRESVRLGRLEKLRLLCQEYLYPQSLISDH